MRRLGAAAAGLVALALLGSGAGPAAADGEGPTPSASQTTPTTTVTPDPTPVADVACRISDEAILESSGLALVAGTLVTVNDSGDGARVFALDPTTCVTTAVIPWSGEATDVEALAPGAGGHVWVGDIGDNRRVRPEVRLVDLPLDGAPARVYRAAYVGGQSRDAEALLRHPVTGRLYVVTKDVFGGQVFAAPADLTPDGVNRLSPLGGPVTGVVTDGAFLPDGRHLLLRTYDRLVAYSFPALEQVGSTTLPPQEQGEGLAVLDDETVLLSSEGRDSEVLRLELPEPMLVAMRGTATPDASPEASPADGGSEGDAWADQRPVLPWFFGGFLGLAVLMVLARALRPR